MEVSDISEQDKELNCKYKKLDQVINRYQPGDGQLIRILQEAQNIFGYLPEEVQTYIAGKTGIPVSEVNGVVTFYSLFSTEPKGKVGINVCMGTACYVQGAGGIIENFRRELKLTDRDTSDDGFFTVKSTRCVGACGLAPVITVNGKVQGGITSKNVPKIIRQCRKMEEKETGEITHDQQFERPTTNQEPAPPGP